MTSEATLLVRGVHRWQREGLQEITYASKSFVTTDAIADSLLELVTTLDREQHAEAVTVPAFTDSGRQVEAKMTLDAGSELVVVPVDLDLDDSFDTAKVEAALDSIRSRIAAVRSTPTARYADPADFSSIDLDDY